MITNCARAYVVKSLYLGMLLSFATPLPVSGAENPSSICSRADAIQAEEATDRLNTWDEVHGFYKRFRSCYDGGIAEGVHDKVQLLWANHWNQLPRMLALFRSDDGFRRFIWPIIKVEDFPQDAFKKVLANAQRNCPRDGADFCAAIKEALPSP
jgi:hypothetical protein